MERPRPAILLVDDMKPNLDALEALLEDFDCEVVRASSGNEALRALLKRPFALVLLDVQMPEMDGYEVASYAHEDPATREVPIIFVTATHDTLENALRGYRTGAVDCLFKPINPHILRSKVRVFLDLYASKASLRLEMEAHKTTAAALEASNDALRHFTHAASHDLGAPLRAIDGFLAILEEDVGPKLSPAEKNYLDMSRKGAARMRALLDALLVYGGLRRPVAHVEVDTDAVLADVRGDLRARLDESGGTLEVAPLPRLRGDPHRIYQLFLNLVGNALKFRRPDVPAKVSVDVEEREGELTFVVADNGIGLEPQFSEAIFEAFRRLHGASKYEGTGLGLAICRQIVEQHGGRIWVESEPGAGSRFCFTLA